MTTKWDDLVEVAAIAGAIMPTWKALTEMERKARRIEMDTALRALLANGNVIVPGEPTVEMIKAWGDSFWRGDNQGEGITAALSAGSIKPEGE